MKTLSKLALISSLLFASGCFKTDEKTVEPVKEQSEEKIRIKTAHGDIIFKLLPEVAPITTERFKELVDQDYYNGLIFHRVIPGFVAQGGDPKGTGEGGSGKRLKAEFSDLKHKKGTVAMARGQDINSADSQFYIALDEQPHLDGKYTIFGEVVEGLDTVDKIKQGDKMLSVSLE
ncbi:MAG: peptidylprolyl isomerase [Bacteriovoracaceae bacterium]